MNVILKIATIAATGALLASCTPHQQGTVGGALAGGAIGSLASGGDPAVTLGAAALGGALGGAASSPQPHYRSAYERCRYHGYSHRYCRYRYGY